MSVPVWYVCDFVPSIRAPARLLTFRYNNDLFDVSFQPGSSHQRREGNTVVFGGGWVKFLMFPDHV